MFNTEHMERKKKILNYKYHILSRKRFHSVKVVIQNKTKEIVYRNIYKTSSSYSLIYILMAT